MTTPNDVNELREELAAYAHEAWSNWMIYLFSECNAHPSGTGAVIIPTESARRWTRQMNTPYEDLPESEKESDRKEADRMLNIMCIESSSES